MPGTWIEIRSARLALRPVRESDVAALFPLFADWDVIRWLSSPPWPYTREDMQSFIREQAARGRRGCGDAFRDHPGANADR